MCSRTYMCIFGGNTIARYNSYLVSYIRSFFSKLSFLSVFYCTYILSELSCLYAWVSSCNCVVVRQKFYTIKYLFQLLLFASRATTTAPRRVCHAKHIVVQVSQIGRKYFHSCRVIVVRWPTIRCVKRRFIRTCATVIVVTPTRRYFRNRIHVQLGAQKSCNSANFWCCAHIREEGRSAPVVSHEIIPSHSNIAQDES